MKKYYKLSKDYDKLFGLISEGYEIAAFIENCLNQVCVMDICSVRRDGEYSVSISCRGTTYGNIYPFHEDDGSEKELFIRLCKKINLEWIVGGPLQII